MIKGESFKNVRLKILPREILLECKNCRRSSRITKWENDMMDFSQVDEARKALGLDEEAGMEEIKEAFRRLSLMYHPDSYKGADKKKCEEMIRTINHAKDVILTYCANYRYSFSEKDIKKNLMDKDLYEHLKRFYDGWLGDLDL